MTRTALYRHYDADGALLYVGVSLSPVKRTSEHSRSAKWFRQITRIEIEWFDCREGAEQAERKAIQSEAPRHNRAHASTGYGLAVIAHFGEAAGPSLTMKHPQALIDRFGGAAQFAAAASAHPDAPKDLSRAAVYQWKQRDQVPFMWRSIVRDLACRAPVASGDDRGAA